MNDTDEVARELARAGGKECPIEALPGYAAGLVLLRDRSHALVIGTLPAEPLLQRLRGLPAGDPVAAKRAVCELLFERQSPANPAKSH